MRQILYSMAALWAFAALLAPTDAFAADECQYNGHAYSQGATICECPTFSGFKLGYSAQNGRMTGRRLICEQNSWEPTQTLCFDLNFGTSNDLYDLLATVSEHFCQPAIAVVPHS